MLDFFTDEKFLIKTLNLAIIIAAGVLVYYVIKFILDTILTINKKSNKLNVKRQKTLNSVLTNIAKYTIMVILILVVLKQLGVNTTSILASIGIIGLIIGWALQDVIKDFAAGLFIIFDRQYEVGDYVDIQGFFGEVIEMGLKTTKVIAFTGEIRIFNNSTVGNVTNYSQHNSVLEIDVGIDYKENTDKIIKILEDLEDEIRKLDGVKNDIKVLGVQELGDSKVVYRILVETKPADRFSVRRKVLKLVKDEMERQKVTIPFPQIEVHNAK